MGKVANELINESSPYLLQHAYNPVHWVRWSDSVFEQAKKENKMVLVSIGYSACHWCHVMEHECFEDEEVAALMNKLFINVKVDREERPDVDQVYMTAVQLMSQKGGWPLNCFMLPDGRPIYGGTYYPKEQWMQVLKSLFHTFTNDREKVEEYASNLHQGITASELITAPKKLIAFDKSRLTELLKRWSNTFDLTHGGPNRAPKFPLPNNYEFLLDYQINTGEVELKEYVELTLNKMALGGIYDHVGGGFSRYSVDEIWKVPHFEKMLYDNGQLISLYSEGYKRFQNPLYKRLVYQTIGWLEREMMHENGSFYAALDADSEGVEGKFYVWKIEELRSVLGKDYTWVEEFYSLNENGLWEEGNYILLRQHSDREFQKKMKWSEEKFDANVKRVNRVLLNARGSRIRPGLDDKGLTSWNAIMLKGLCDAYSVFAEQEFLQRALKTAEWLLECQLKPDGGLWHNYKNGRSSIDGFLEDYAHTISAFIALYKVTYNEDWLAKAKKLTDYTLQNFLDSKSKMFFFTSEDTKLIARKMEINDNVLPASNSVMARNLYYLSRYFDSLDYEATARQMLTNVYDGMEKYGSGYSNWAILLNHFVFGFYEFVIVGNDAASIARELQVKEVPEVLIAVSSGESELPIFKDKSETKETMIYVCKQGNCFLPTNDLNEAIRSIQ
jgi:uncharacterized protein YyaL (SSP411 family)